MITADTAPRRRISSVTTEGRPSGSVSSSGAWSAVASGVATKASGKSRPEARTTQVATSARIPLNATDVAKRSRPCALWTVAPKLNGRMSVSVCGSRSPAATGIWISARATPSATESTLETKLRAYIMTRPRPAVIGVAVGSTGVLGNGSHGKSVTTGILESERAPTTGVARWESLSQSTATRACAQPDRCGSR